MGAEMKIGLIDVDSHNYPNLALMKISAWHKLKGEHVEWWNGFTRYDTVYKSRVFDDTYSEDEHTVITADEVVKGGTGYGLDNHLPDEIEHIYPDYGLYGEKRAIGFLTRGCPRNCEFCIVSEKEGRKSTQVAELSEFWRGQKDIELLDPNITASKNCEELFDSLIKSGARINFTQGLDVRLLTEMGARQINEMKINTIHFAWDNYEMDTYNQLKRTRPLLKKNGRDIGVYVLTNFNTTHEQDIERIYKLKELDYSPYVMIYDKPNAPKVTRHLQRWCNNRFIFRACERFEDFNTGDHKCSYGDYIIKGVRGEFYPCKPDIFEQTYEKVVEQEEQK